MSTFSQPFFSFSGQAERLTNVGQTLLSSITGKGVQSNTGIPIIDKPLSYAASNPFTTALVGAAAVNPSAAIGTVKAGFSSLNPTAKVISLAAVPVVIGAVASNPKIVLRAGELPASGGNIGSNIGTYTKNPTFENAANIFKDNPFLVSAGLIGGGLVVGKGISSIGASIANTAAVRENTQLTSQVLSNADSLLTKKQDSAGSIIALPAQSSYTTPFEEQKAYTNDETAAQPDIVAPVTTTKKTYIARRKSKNINTRPITVRNNILIANKNG
jgi:hypothetical protein